MKENKFTKAKMKKKDEEEIREFYEKIHGEILGLKV